MNWGSQDSTQAIGLGGAAFHCYAILLLCNLWELGQVQRVQEVPGRCPQTQVPQAIWGFLVLRRVRDLFSSGAPRTSPLWAGAMPLSGRHCLCEKSWVPLPAGTLPMIHTEQPADTSSMKPSQIPSRGDTFF